MYGSSSSADEARAEAGGLVTARAGATEGVKKRKHGTTVRTIQLEPDDQKHSGINAVRVHDHGRHAGASINSTSTSGYSNTHTDKGPSGVDDGMDINAEILAERARGVLFRKQA